MNVLKKDEFNFSKEEHKEIYWHSSAHILAYAVKRLYPSVKVAIGPAIKAGFYYDFDNLDITEEDLKKIQNEMRRIIKSKEAFVRDEISKSDAIKLFHDEPYKLKLIEAIPKNETISIYRLGEFIDLCRGPHIETSSMVGAYKLLKVAGAYWRGDSDNKMLTRIYGISFPTKDELKEYTTLQEEAKKRDHRVLGKKLDLFSFSEYAPGFPYFHNNGLIIIDELTNFWKDVHREHSYEFVNTPQMMKKELWELSGHWAKFKENMYITEVEGEDFAIKPMNCPGGMLVYKEKKHSYKEFPLRVGELGFVHRQELSGTLTGLFRVRGFTQDDAHIFVTEEQISDEIKDIFEIVNKMYGKFNLSYRVVLSTRPEVSIGSDEIWGKTTSALKLALEQLNFDYEIEEGEGAFYGPKIDILLKDALGREHQCGTIQMDMNLPERFDLNYVGADNIEHRPIMFHRVIYGSLERFFGILIEHFAGKFPLWLSPEQITIIPVAEPFTAYAKTLATKLKESGLRADADLRDTSMNRKIRDWEKRYVNYIIIVGETEEKNQSVNVRVRDIKEQINVSFDEFLEKVSIEKKDKLIRSIFK